jgi:hypothetical protein
MASILVLIIILGCAAGQYLKGTLVSAAATAIAGVSAAFAALGYYEFLGGILGRYMGGMAAWCDLIGFVVLFILVFAVLQTAITQLVHEPIDLGHWPEQIGRPVCGALLGYVVAGVLLTAAALAPLPLGYPYIRFEDRRPDPDRPSGALLYPDEFVCGWFGLVSRGSLLPFGDSQSFSAVRAGFLDQLYLNRLGGDAVTVRLEPGTQAIEVRSPAVWEAPEGITDTEGRPLPSKPGHTLMLVRIGFRNVASRESNPYPFPLSQLRLICKPRDLAREPLAGKGKAVYPIGYMQQARQMAVKGLDQQISIESRDFGSESVRTIDFGFLVPNGSIPVLAEFKLNNLANVPAPAAADQAPQVIPFEMHKESRQAPQDANQPAAEPNAAAPAR